MSSMSYLGNFEITFTNEPDRQHPGLTRLVTSLTVDDVSALPTALKELAKTGVDLTATVEALHEIEEEQRKSKAEELEENRRTALAGLGATSKRVVIAYNKVGGTRVGTAEGVIYRDGNIHIMNSMQHPFGGIHAGDTSLTSLAKAQGYELFVKRLD